MIELPEIKHIIAIASGKGGVGKSTTAVNLALALQNENKSVGLLDADIYGPSQHIMLGITEKPTGENKLIDPIIKYGLQTMSIAYFIDPNAPAVWRGPMVSTALQQLFRDTRWKKLDYLIVDLPPGTGDIQLTLAQKIPVTGAIIITTPQDIALSDAKKALKMFQKVNVPILGIIENMSMYTCSHCGHKEPIFGEGGAEKMRDEFTVELLGQLPLDKKIREEADSGKPTVMASPESFITHIYQSIAQKIIHKISEKNRLQSKLPKVTVK